MSTEKAVAAAAARRRDTGIKGRVLHLVEGWGPMSRAELMTRFHTNQNGHVSTYLRQLVLDGRIMLVDGRYTSVLVKREPYRGYETLSAMQAHTRAMLCQADT
jgi:hypothetical protein